MAEETEETAAEKRTRLLRQIRDLEREIAGLSGEAKKNKQLELESAQNHLNILTRSADTLKEHVEQSKNLLDNYKELKNSAHSRWLVGKQQAKVYAEEKLHLEAVLRDSDEINEGDLSRLRVLSKLIVQQDLINERQNRYKISLGQSVTAGQELGTAFGALLSVYGTNPIFNVDNMVKFGKVFHSLIPSIQGVKDTFKTLGDSEVSQEEKIKLLKSNFAGFSEMLRTGVRTAVVSLANTFLNLMFALNESETAFQRTTGASQDMAREMTRGYERTRENTVTLAQNQEAWSALYGTYTDFTMISATARKEIGDTVATLNNLGVSAESAAKGMQTAAVAFGQSGTEAAKTLIELEGYARDIGVAPAQLIEQYGAMGGSLAKLGENGTRAFKDLARVSKITGLEMQKLLTMTDKFDTFEGAAEQAGKLNAALGMNAVNAMDLLMETDPAARFDQIRSSILDAGLSFDSMSYYQRKFFTESLGLDSVGDLAAVMRGDMEGLGGEIGKTAQDYEKMAERAKNVATIKEKLLALVMRLIHVFMPLIDSLDKTLTAWLENKDAIEGFKDGAVELIPIFKGLVPLFKNIGKLLIWMMDHWVSAIGIFVGVKVALAVLPPLIMGLIGLIPGLGAAAGTMGASMTAGALGMLAFGAAAVGIGGGIWLAAQGITALIGAIREASWDDLGQFAVAIAAVSLAIWGLNAALTAVGGNPLATAGMGILLGIGGAAAGISLLVNAFKKDKTEMEDLSKVMGSFGTVSEEQFAAANVAFAQMKDSINEMDASNLSNLAVTTAVLPTIVTTQAVAAAGATGGAGGRGGPGAAASPQKVDVSISFNETAGRYFVVETMEDNAIAMANNQCPVWSGRGN